MASSIPVSHAYCTELCSCYFSVFSVLLSGPSGSGKSHMLGRIMEDLPKILTENPDYFDKIKVYYTSWSSKHFDKWLALFSEKIEFIRAEPEPDDVDVQHARTLYICEDMLTNNRKGSQMLVDFYTGYEKFRS